MEAPTLSSVINLISISYIICIVDIILGIIINVIDAINNTNNIKLYSFPSLYSSYILVATKTSLI